MQSPGFVGEKEKMEGQVRVGWAHPGEGPKYHLHGGLVLSIRNTPLGSPTDVSSILDSCFFRQKA